MINNLEEAKAYSVLVCKESPEDKDRLNLNSPLVDAEALKVTIQSLPKSYCDVAGQVALKGKVSGYFLLWPEAFDKGTLVDTLVEANSEKSPFAEYFQRIGVYQVASYEAEPIVVVCEGMFNEGDVLKVDIGNPAFNTSKLASSFEEFLLIVVSLEKAVMTNQGKAAFDAFLDDVQNYTNKDIAENWRVISEIAFGC